jgi:hypothetical protein
MFITSKLWNTKHAREDVFKACEQTLKASPKFIMIKVVGSTTDLFGFIPNPLAILF